MRIGRIDISLAGPLRSRSDVLECSVESTASHTYISVLTEGGSSLEVHAISLAIVEKEVDDGNRQLRVCLPLETDGGPARSAAIVACPPRSRDGGLHIAVLAETGAMVVLDLSPYLASPRGVGAPLEYSALDARHRVSVFREPTQAQARPVCMAPVRLSATFSGLQDVTYLILAGFSDGSIMEIYGVDGSFIKRRHVFSFTYPIQSIRPSPLADQSGTAVMVAECRRKTGESVLFVLSKEASVGEDMRHLKDDDDDDDGIWKECDPSFSYDDAAHLERVNVKSFFVHNSDLWSGLELTIPSKVLAARIAETTFFPPPFPPPLPPHHAAPSPRAAHQVAILLPGPLSASACLQSYLHLARDDLRGVTLLSRAPYCAGPTDVFMATLSPALSAIFIFSLASSPSADAASGSTISKCSPVAQVDLLPLLHIGMEKSEEAIVVQEAAFLQDGHLLLGTSQRCLLVCSSELVVLRRFSLQGDILAISPALTITSTSVYAHFTTPDCDAPQPPPAYTLIVDSLTSSGRFPQLTTSGCEDAPLISALTQICDSGPDFVDVEELMKMWQEPFATADSTPDVVFLLLFRSLQSLLPWEISDGDHTSPQSPSARILAWAAQHAPSSIPRLIDAFIDFGDLSHAALLQEQTKSHLFSSM